MGKREENKIEKQLKKEIIDGIKASLNGSGWKKKHGSFFKSIGENFYCASVYPFIDFENSQPTIGLNARYEAKPMGIDPIYWDIAEMPENKNEPLSFRAWAAFKTDPACFHLTTTITENCDSIHEAITSFVDWIQKETERVKNIMETTLFSEVYESLNPDPNVHSYDAATMICALILEERANDALSIARNLAPTSYRGLYQGGKPQNQVNFFELAILFLAGEKAFHKEVRSKRDWSFDQKQ